ncbi:MAG: hypothetical protein V3U96_11680 [Paracoccaceae bacterium]
MNIERLITMFIRLFMRNIMNRGINAGMKLATKGRGKKPDHPAKDQGRLEAAKKANPKPRL